MRRRIIIAVTAISMAGAASANHFTTFPKGTAPSQAAALSERAPAAVQQDDAPPSLSAVARLDEPHPETGPGPRVEPRVGPHPGAGAKPASSPVHRGAALEARRSPVPLQVKPRRPEHPPTA